MGTTKTEIKYDIIEEVIANLQSAVEDTMIVSSTGQMDINDIDLADVFVDSTGDSAQELKNAYSNVKSAYDLINTLICTSINLLTEIKDKYQAEDALMEEAVSSSALVGSAAINAQSDS